jgi:hypothetical protein
MIDKKYTIIKPDPSLKSNLMAWGFMCDEGWHPLIYELLDKIQAIVDREGYDFQVTEIKEKFGGLRVYLDSETDEIFDLIREYEQKSFTICEVCGKHGKLRNLNGWYKTLCDDCRKDKR